MASNILKEYIEKLVELDKEEEKYKTIYSNIKKEKETLNTTIIEFMENNNITNKDIIFGNQKIRYVTNNTVENITKKLIFERLKLFLKNESMAHEATNFIYLNRTSTKKNCIKISGIKVT